jgi:drug/metabolite transporter (DMT)-like permease
MRAGGVRSDPAGYAIVLAGYLLMSATAPLVAFTHAPTGVVLSLRMAIAATALAALFARRGFFRDWRRPGNAPRLLLMGALSAGCALLFFVAIRMTTVAVAMLLMFMMPVWVALIAPRLFRTRREPVVVPALGLALGGLLVILLPDLLSGVSVSVTGVALGAAAGLSYAAFALVVKGLTRRGVAATTISLTEAALDALFVLPLALWQLADTGQGLTVRDLTAIVLMGLVCTAFAHTLWAEGTRRVRVEHVSILGYVEPVAAAVYAYFLVGQRPGIWTVAGGALIIAAGVLVILFGAAEGETSVAELAEAEPI